MLQASVRVSGVSLPSDCLVTVTGVDGHVHTATGDVFQIGSLASDQGMYHGRNSGDRDINVLLANPAHATLNRIDLVVARFNDTVYTGALDTLSIEMVTGTPNASPAVPAAPANSLILCQVLIRAATATILSTDLTDKRVVATKQPVLIATLSGALASYDFQNIMPGFRNLRIRYLLRDNSANATATFGLLRFNNDSTANYNNEDGSDTAGTLAAAESLSQTALVRAVLASSGGQGAGQYSCGEIEIFSYSDTVSRKAYAALIAQDNGDASGGTISRRTTGRWKTSNAAINRATLSPGAGTAFDANSWAQLLGEPA